ncbi:APG5-domain-containing protein [Neoconidiobolus thromboides FSU 785]|nr:APG5-domain-containing protein [Neoconidiobolus thromboides FSU 785]
MLTNDESIKELVWYSKIPVIFQFNTEDKINLPSTPPNLEFEEYYTLVPKNSYFSLNLFKVVTYIFLNVMNDPDFSWEEIWLEYKGIPLKWHFPVGLLHDLLTHKDKISNIKKDTWEVVIRYGNYPSDKLYRVAKFTAENPLPDSDYFMSMIKESNYIRHGNTKKVMNLTKEEHIQLWESLISHDFKAFWNIQSTLNSYDLTLNFKESNNNEFPKHIPFRLYYSDSSKTLDYPSVIQELISPFNSEENEKEETNDKLITIGDCVYNILKDIVNIQDMSRDLDTFDIIIQSISVPLNTPLIWLYLHLMYPDSFLHIVVTDKKS